MGRAELSLHLQEQLRETSGGNPLPFTEALGSLCYFTARGVVASLSATGITRLPQDRNTGPGRGCACRVCLEHAAWAIGVTHPLTAVAPSTSGTP